MENKTIHHTILKPQYQSNMMHPLTKQNLDKWVDFNNELSLTQKIWTHDECVSFLESFDKNVLYWFNFEPDGRYKSDIVRLCLLYEFGGIYVDVDQEPLVGFKDYLDLSNYDFCGCSNMGLHNVSNGFIYAKKGSVIIKKNIEEIIKRYETNGPRGGCHVMGSVITELINGEPLKMPLGEIQIGSEKCLFLHEIGDESLPDGTQAFYNSFGVYADNDTLRVMNSRYSTYYMDRNKQHEFIKI
jgi:hypothetical protein